MFRYLALLCVVAAVTARPGLLAPSVSIAAAPTLVSTPTVGIVRSAPIAIGTIGAPLTLNGGLISSGLLGGELVAGRLLPGTLISGGVLPGGLVSSKLGLIR